jgi:hypothetical protein
MLKALPAGAVSLASTYILFQQLYSPAPYWILIPAGITFMTVYTLIFLKIGGLTEYDKELIITSGRKIGKEDLTRKALAILT